MKNLTVLALTLLVFGIPSLLPAQVANEGLANQIIAARQRNAALMKQYSWNCRTEISENGTPKDTRIDTVTFGPDGQPQHAILNDQANPLPRGFVRRRLAEKEREDTENFLKALRTFLHQYTLPTAGAVINFISNTPITPPGPDGMLQLSGGSVVVPGDTLSLWVDARSRQPRRMRIMTYYQGYQITVTATFNTIGSGLNYMAFGQVDAPALGMTVLVQNFDYMNQGF